MNFKNKSLDSKIIEFNRATKKKRGNIKMIVPEHFIDLLENKIFGGCKIRNIKLTWEELED